MWRRRRWTRLEDVKAYATTLFRGEDTTFSSTRRFFAIGAAGTTFGAWVPRTVVCATSQTMVTAIGSPATLAGSNRACDIAPSIVSTARASLLPAFGV